MVYAISLRMCYDIDMKWNNDFSYAIGLITTDGSLSKDGRHIILTSKDKEQISNFIKALKIRNNIIGIKRSTYAPQNIYFQIQFSNVGLYRELLKIGLSPNKTKTVGEIAIPKRYFADFLRGHLDGDGCTYSYYDPRWKSSFMLYTSFVSASKKHLIWMKDKIIEYYGIEGRLSFQGSSTYCLRFAKRHSILLLREMYKNKNSIYLSRKRLKIDRALGIINQ